MKGKFLLWFIGAWIFFLIPLSAAFYGKPLKETSVPSTITVWNGETQAVMELPLEEYLKGVVAAEMPASFEAEALKAQAVAARTYSLNRAEKGENEAHPAAVVCTDSAHCKGYKTEAKAKEDWGDAGEEYWRKISSAVEETKGEIVVYEQKPIDAVFHAASAGRTANSEDVWSASVPYLRSVESPGEEVARDYHTKVEVPFSEFCQKIKSIHGEATITDSSSIGTPVTGEGGYVKHVEIGGVNVTGSELRTLFSLRSTAFTVEKTENTVIFSVTGYGHGVGLSQYGANAMAKGGADYKTILATYYTGTTVEQR